MLQSTLDHGANHYGPTILTPTTLARVATSPETWEEICSFHQLLATDEYTQYVDAYYRANRERFGKYWHYHDIVNVLYAAGKCLKPRSYMEIGVRRGRSASAVVRSCPTVGIVAFDMWIQNYAGMENPGPEFVKDELARHGHTGQLYFVNGDSHETVPAFFEQNPQLQFDMITVDGDHSDAGAYDDLCNVIPRLSVGGVLVFDDIAHPAHPYLANVWLRAMARFPFLAHYEYTEAGFGVAFAIRTK
ncbi:class I SAM-dependent methyltransferase [Geomonas sp. Red32]|uniref:class I SAM-dependent methyltransferase n=1 Tax=Geomonas sp. Red32 TaxID=2912856 RepID=UPI00202CE8C9|nr:class I SAM-dependent methyltransferase [Geomonas sp. Red32]MCM0081184.1 class I SAM-dependent methyltransferase [Geomonas sp. Red32]